jgi:hypothetical protein
MDEGVTYFIILVPIYVFKIVKLKKKKIIPVILQIMSQNSKSIFEKTK